MQNNPQNRFARFINIRLQSILLEVLEFLIIAYCKPCSHNYETGRNIGNCLMLPLYTIIILSLTGLICDIYGSSVVMQSYFWPILPFLNYGPFAAYHDESIGGRTCQYFVIRLYIHKQPFVARNFRVFLRKKLINYLLKKVVDFQIDSCDIFIHLYTFKEYRSIWCNFFSINKEITSW